MKKSQEKGGGVGSLHNNRQIRIAVFGKHDVGKSALTVRYLTRRYIGEYKSNTDLLYRQTITLSRGNSLEIEIIDISTSTVEIGPHNPVVDQPTQTLPWEELHRSHGFIIVYSITDRSSFSIALQALEDIQDANNSCPTAVNSNPCQSPLVVTLIGNKCDLEHYRTVEKREGISASGRYGKCSFYELSVAENYPEVYSAFQSIISSLSTLQPVPEPRRKYSIGKMFGNLRLCLNTSPSYPLTSNVSMTAVSEGGYAYSLPNSGHEGTADSKGSCSLFQSKPKLHSVKMGRNN